MKRLNLAAALSLLIVGLVVPLGPVAAQGLTNEQQALVNRFDRICVKTSPDYDLQKCEEWWRSLSDGERNFLRKYYEGDQEGQFETADGDFTVASFPLWESAKEIEAQWFEGDFAVRRSSFGSRVWRYHVVHRWCSNDEGTRISGCLWSDSDVSSRSAWDFIRADETRRRTTSTEKRWSRVYYQGHFKQSTAVWTNHCWPEIEMTAWPLDRWENVVHQVNFAYQNC